MRSSVVIAIVLTSVLVGVHGAMIAPRSPAAPNCDVGMNWSQLAVENNCAWECRPYDEAMADISAQVDSARSCNQKVTGKKSPEYWDNFQDELLANSTCAITKDNDPAVRRLCVNSVVVMALTNLITEHCDPGIFSMMYQEPVSQTGILGCSSYNTYPFNSVFTPQRPPPGDGRSLTCSDIGGCTAHIFKDVIINSECTAVCVHAVCSSDLTLPYCLAQTTNIGLTIPDCHENAMTRPFCFPQD